LKDASPRPKQAQLRWKLPAKFSEGRSR